MKTPDQIKDEYTISKPCCVEDMPDAKTVWLKVGAQSFCLDGYQDTTEEAEWLRLMLGKALSEIIRSETAHQPARTP